jgi:hypothetical protein
MSFTVSEETIKETTKCEHDFSCLESGQCGDEQICDFSRPDGTGVLFLKTKDHLSCPYRVHFGGCQLCKCPTHFAIAMECLGKSRAAIVF